MTGINPAKQHDSNPEQNLPPAVAAESLPTPEAENELGYLATPARVIHFSDSFRPAVSFIAQEETDAFLALPGARKDSNFDDFHFLKAGLAQESTPEETATEAPANQPDAEAPRTLTQKFLALFTGSKNTAPAAKTEVTTLGNVAPERAPSDTDLFCERVVENPDVLEQFIDNYEALIDELIESLDSEPNNYNFVRLFLATRQLDAQSSAFDMTGYTFKQMNQPEMATRVKEIKETRINHLTNKATLALSSSPHWDCVIEALAVSSLRDANRFISYGLNTFLDSALQKLRPESVDATDLRPLERFSEFLLHTMAFEQEKSSGRDFELPGDRFSGKYFAYNILDHIIRSDAGWLFQESATRTVFQSLLEQARQNYFSYATTPIEATGSALREASFNNAMFVTYAFPYEREALRTTALKLGSVGTMHAISFGHGSEGMTEASCEAATDVLLAIATAYRKVALSSRFADINPEYALQSAAQLGMGNPGEGLGYTLGSTLERTFSRSGAIRRAVSARYVEKANSEQQEVWNALASNYHNVGEVFIAATRTGASSEAIRTFVGNVGLWGAHEFLDELSRKLPAEVISHLMLITKADAASLAVFAREFKTGKGLFPASFSEGELLSATSIQDLVTGLTNQYTETIKPKVQQLLATATELQTGAPPQKEYLEAQVAKLPLRVDEAVQRIFSEPASLSKEHFEKLMESPVFIEYLTGVKDLEMQLPPTYEQRVIIGEASEQLIKLFPLGIFEPLASQPEASAEIADRRSKVRRDLFAGLQTELPALENLDQKEILEAFAAHFELREQAWSLICNPEFQAKFLDQMLRNHGSEPLQITFRVAAKSDTITWSQDPDHSQIMRADCSVLELKFEGESHSSLLWKGEDEISLILAHLPTPHALDSYRDVIQKAATSFLVDYMQGKLEVQTPVNAANQLDMQQLVLGPTYASDRHKRTLEATSLIKPVGDTSSDIEWPAERLLTDSRYQQFILWKKNA